MQSLDDDMDEMFRRAAKDYPLNTNSANWDKLVDKLEAGSNNTRLDNKKKDHRLMWLLLLLPLGILIGRYMGSENKANGALESTETGKTDHKVEKSTRQSSPLFTPFSNESRNLPATISDTTGESNTKPKATIVPLPASNSTFLMSDRIKNSALNQNSDIYKKARKITRNRPFFNKINNVSSGIDDAEVLTGATVNKKGKSISTAASSKQDSTLTAPDASNSMVKSETILLQNDSGRSPAKGVTTVPDNNKNKEKKTQSLQSRFSYSIIAGPDISIIKRQRTSKAGYSIGLIFGYAISDKITVEAGVLWDRKNYYSGGKYIDTSRLKLPGHSKIVDAEGFCNMIEIPVNVRYAFAIRPKHSWFVSAGFSSYIMKEEDYSLRYERYNQPYSRNYRYTNSTENWFSIVSLGIGHQLLLGKNTNLNVAPYLKLPLKGVGIGKLPISSTGIYISFQRYIK